MNIRVRLIQKVLDLNEKIIFNARLKKYYQEQEIKGDVNIVDVGANKGQSIEFFLRLYPNAKIYSFEPNPVLYRKLARKYRNSLDGKVNIYQKGVSSQEGKLIFQESIMDESSTIEDLNYNSVYMKKKAGILGLPVEKIIKSKYEIEVVSLKEFIRTEEIKKIDILKIDTEGHEFDVLKGLFPVANCSIKYIQLEYHYNDMYVNRPSINKIDELLCENGFVLSSKIKHGFADFEDHIYRR
jgi:FkbM family methyltransferase